MMDVVEEFIPALASGLNLVEDIDALEREVAQQQIIEKHAQRPHICLLAVAVSRQNLWRHVDLSPAVSYGTLLVADGPSQSEVAYFTKISTPAVLSQENVFKFDIAMDYAVLVHVVKTLQYLQADGCGFGQSKHSPRLATLTCMEIAEVAVLHDKEVPVALFEGLEQFDDIGVIQHGHRVYLLQQESLQLRVLAHLALPYALDCEERTRGGTLGGQQDVSEPALAQLSHCLELAAVQYQLRLRLQAALQHLYHIISAESFQSHSTAKHYWSSLDIHTDCYLDDKLKYGLWHLMAYAQYIQRNPLFAFKKKMETIIYLLSILFGLNLINSL